MGITQRLRADEHFIIKNKIEESKREKYILNNTRDNNLFTSMNGSICQS